jgi:flagellar hook-length control protein FliK
LSIAAALLMPTLQPLAGEGKPAAPASGDAFAALLDAALFGETPAAAAPTAIVSQTFPTLSPALQLQDGLIAGIAVTAAASVPPQAPAFAAALVSGVATNAADSTQAFAATDPSSPAATTEIASPAIDFAAAGSNAAGGATTLATPEAETSQAITAEPVVSGMPVAEAPTVAIAVLAVAAIMPTVKAAVSPTDKPIEGEAETAGNEEGAAPVASVPSQPAATVAPTSATSPIAVSPTPAVPQAAAEAAPAIPQRPGVEPDTSAPADDAAAPSAETRAPDAPASTNRTASPAAAQTSAQIATAAAAEAAAPKPDSASMIATQVASAPDATSQTTASPTETNRAPTTPPALQSAPAATLQVYNRIIERADGRAQRFEIRLDPAELGRVDVRIEIGADKKVHAVLAAHDSAALSDLMRGQRALERALTDAGLDLADKGVRFELASDNGSSASQQRNGAGNGRDAQANVWRRFETMTMPATAETAAVVQPSWRPQRLDLVA